MAALIGRMIKLQPTKVTWRHEARWEKRREIWKSISYYELKFALLNKVKPGGLLFKKDRGVSRTL